MVAATAASLLEMVWGQEGWPSGAAEELHCIGGGRHAAGGGPVSRARPACVGARLVCAHPRQLPNAARRLNRACGALLGSRTRPARAGTALSQGSNARAWPGGSCARRPEPPRAGARAAGRPPPPPLGASRPWRGSRATLICRPSCGRPSYPLTRRKSSTAPRVNHRGLQYTPAALLLCSRPLTPPPLPSPCPAQPGALRTAATSCSRRLGPRMRLPSSSSRSRSGRA